MYMKKSYKSEKKLLTFDNVQCIISKSADKNKSRQRIMGS